MPDWRTGGNLDRVRAEAAMDHFNEAVPTPEEEARMDDARDAMSDAWLRVLGRRLTSTVERRP
jgi:hypothetical protein